MTAPAKTRTFAALKVRNYRLFFTGQVISNTGTWMQRIAQDWLVLQITNSPFAVGVTTALQFLPMMLFGLFGGLIADRYPKRRLLLMTQSSMGVLAVILATLTLTGHVQVWHVYLIAFGLGLATVVDNPARQTFVNEMVPHDLVRNAVSLNSANFQLARVLGPAVAGVVISAVGSGWAFAFNAMSYLAVLTALLLMRTADLRPTPRVARDKGQLMEGLRYVRTQPNIMWIIILVFFVGTFGYNFAIILSAYAKNVFVSGASVYGLLNSAMAIGSVIGAVLAARRTTGSMRFLFASAAGFGAMLMLLGLTTWLVPFLVLLLITGLVSITFNTTANSTVQLTVDPALRGRVMSLYMLVFLGGTPVGSPIVGAITERWGAPFALVLTGGICLVSTIACAVLAARQAGLHMKMDLHHGTDHLLTMVTTATPVQTSTADGTAVDGLAAERPAASDIPGDAAAATAGGPAVDGLAATAVDMPGDAAAAIVDGPAATAVDIPGDAAAGTVDGPAATAVDIPGDAAVAIVDAGQGPAAEGTPLVRSQMSTTLTGESSAVAPTLDAEGAILPDNLSGHRTVGTRHLWKVDAR